MLQIKFAEPTLKSLEIRPTAAVAWSSDTGSSGGTSDGERLVMNRGCNKDFPVVQVIQWSFFKFLKKFSQISFQTGQNQSVDILLSQRYLFLRSFGKHPKYHSHQFLVLEPLRIPATISEEKVRFPWIFHKPSVLALKSCPSSLVLDVHKLEAGLRKYCCADIILNHTISPSSSKDSLLPNRIFLSELMVVKKVPSESCYLACKISRAG
jgi:hypothetical protein